MRVYKFGGASVKDAAGVRNVVRILQAESETDLMIVISAMGKTTNALEAIVNAYYSGDAPSLDSVNISLDNETYKLISSISPTPANATDRLEEVNHN